MFLSLTIFLFFRGATASRAVANLLLKVSRRLSIEDVVDVVRLAICARKFEVTSGLRQRFFTACCVAVGGKKVHSGGLREPSQQLKKHLYLAYKKLPGLKCDLDYELAH